MGTAVDLCSKLARRPWLLIRS